MAQRCSIRPRRAALAAILLAAATLLGLGGGCASGVSPRRAALLDAARVREHAGLVGYLTAVGAVSGGEGAAAVVVTDDADARLAVRRYVEMLYASEETTLVNIANAQTTADVDLKNNPYRRRVIRWRDDHTFETAADDGSPGPRRYEPGHPMADAVGYVRYPNVDVEVEAADLRRVRAELRAANAVMQALEPGAVVRPRGYWFANLGIVSGLPGTGDGDWPPFAQVLRAVFPGRSLSPDEMRSFALVSISGRPPLPPRAGDRVVVEVSSMGVASRLDRGVLLGTTLEGVGVGDWVVTVGDTRLVGDESFPTRARTAEYGIVAVNGRARDSR